MKKSLLALAILGVATGAAHAASSVTLYGTAEIAYQKEGGVWQTLKNTNGGFQQRAPGESRVGFKGEEDLGNGMAAFFQLEAKFSMDTGASDGSNFFGEKSVVGLSFVNGAHKVYFGKAPSPIDRLGNNVGHLHTDYSTQMSEGGWRNGAFYDFTQGGFSVVAAATTKGGVLGNASEGVSGTKASYGLSAKYSASNWTFGAGWQADHATVKNEWKVVGSYTFNPVTLSGSYARAKGYAFDKGTTWQAALSGKLTANDTLFVNYGQQKWTYSGVGSNKLTKYGVGYSHALSKRTSVFANIARAKASNNWVGGSSSHSGTGWDLGVKHTF